jgi:hypothetical protein
MKDVPHPVTICVLTYSDYPILARRCLGSIMKYCERGLYRLVVGANAVGSETHSFLTLLYQSGLIDRLIISPKNIGKSPMMRLMLQGISSDFLWWFDDDSYIVDARALPGRLQIARHMDERTVMWGQEMFCDHGEAFCDGDPVAFVRSAPWYRGLTPPSWEPGGKGELNWNDQGTGDGRWNFLTGGGWFARMAALRELDWPDRRLKTLGDDVFLGEAIRQHAWKIHNIGTLGMEINAEPRRWKRD